MVVGENSREQDMEVNPCKEKRLTNVRCAAGGGSAVVLLLRWCCGGARGRGAVCGCGRRERRGVSRRGGAAGRRGGSGSGRPRPALGEPSQGWLSAVAWPRCRTVEADDKIFVTPPRRLTLEDAIGYVGPDELMEVTPAKVRLRKQIRSASQRRAKARNEDKH
jgi:hypothetical protein